MSTEIIIDPESTTKEYTLFNDVFKIYATFTNWNDDSKVEEVEFRIYPFAEYQIKDVYFCSMRDQLEISVVIDEGQNPYIKKFEDFYMNEGKKEDVALIIFPKDEYKKKRCFTVPDDHPERKKGNILVGG